MSRKNSARRMLVVTDERGTIVGTGPVDLESGSGDTPRTTVAPLPGQAVHEIVLPAELEELLAGPLDEFYRGLARYTLRKGLTKSRLLPRTD